MRQQKTKPRQPQRITIGRPTGRRLLVYVALSLAAFGAGAEEAAVADLSTFNLEDLMKV